MAEEIRVQREGATSTTTTDPQEARAEIEQTRSRMSETIDEIEEVLSHKREQLQDKLDVLAPIREKPLPSLGAAFGAGLFLGLVTGGDDDGGRSHDYDEDEAEHWERRARTWENRARRLRDIGREQEEEIHDLQERYGEVRSESMEGRSRRGSGRDDYDQESHSQGGGSGLREQIMHSLTGYLTHSFKQMAGGSTSGGASA